MKNEPTWQTRAVEQLSQIFDQDPDAKAFILSGSLSAADSLADVWSDVDAKIILADHALDRYYLSMAWLLPLGRLIGAERHEDQMAKTLRVCLENFRRFDLTFVAESSLDKACLQKENLFLPPYAVIWSRLPDLNPRTEPLSFSAQYQEISQAELERIVDAFWFKASIAIAKVVRNDLLIGMHLALELARDGLMLQMLRRDREKRTTIHREGGWGNELVPRFVWNGSQVAGEEILNFVKLSCEIFDELASDLLQDYEYRGPLLLPTIALAKQACDERIQNK